MMSPITVNQQNPDDESLPRRRTPVPWGSCGPIEWLLCRLFKRYDITQGNTLYLRRWLLYWTPWGHAFIHKICQDDNDRHLHDHPWDAHLLILRNGYREVAPHRWTGYTVQNRHYAPSLRRMPAEHRHAVKLWRDRETDKPLPAWTIAFCGKYRRAWGFFVDGKWKYWREYLGC